MTNKLLLPAFFIIGLASGFIIANNIDAGDSDPSASTDVVELSNDNGDRAQRIAELQLRIAQLESELNNRKPKIAVTNAVHKEPTMSQQTTNISKTVDDKQDEISPPIETLTMQQVQQKFMADIQSRLKHVLIKMNDREIGAYENRFSHATLTNDWSMEYQDKIANYIRNADPDSMHFVNQLRCNTQLCKLSVTSADPGSWNNLLSGMVNSDWFETISFLNDDETTPEKVYYFERINEDE